MNTEYSQIRNSLGQTKATTQEKSVPKFLRKVFYMLENNQHSDYVSWSADGAAIVVKKPTEFAEEVLPCYFKHNNFASFVRQLNMYNFKKKKNYQYDHTYGHEMFQKGKMDLLRHIQRKSAETTQMMMPKAEIARETQEEANCDSESLIQENLHYKRVQKTLSTQFQFVERKVKDIRTEINTLYDEFHKQEAKEDFLKKVLKNLTDRFGSQSIQSAIEQTVQETTAESSRNQYESKSFRAPAYEAPKRSELPSYAEAVPRKGEKRFSEIFNQDVLTDESSDFQAMSQAEEKYSPSNYGYDHWNAAADKKVYNSDHFLDVNNTAFRKLSLGGAFDADFDILAPHGF